MQNKINKDDIPIISEVAGGGYVEIYKDHEDRVIKKVFRQNKMSFLPEGYEPQEVQSDYLKLTEGKHKFRVLSNAIVGYEYFNKENKPVRSREPFEDKPTDIKEGGKTNEFWAFVIWNYDLKKLQILELTQQSLKAPLLALAQEPDYGDPQNYDLVITREGKGFSDTKYNVLPKPPVPVAEEIEKEYKNTKINLEALYDGKNPFAKE